MRIGLMMGTDTERPRADRLTSLLDGVKAAENQGFASMWLPQIPGYLDAMTSISLIGFVTERIELGTAVVPVQTRHPISMAQQALTTQMACGGRFTLGLGPSHHWVIEDQFGLTYERPARLMRGYLEVLNAAAAGPGRVDVENELFRVHSPLDVTDADAMPILLAALAPVMLRLAGEHASGTVLWMADERAIEEHVVPRITKAASDAGRPAPRIVACVPVALCRPQDVDAARRHTSRTLGHAEDSPNYIRLLERGDATDVGDVLAAGEEAEVRDRLGRFRDVGVTDLAARVLPLGPDPESRLESRRRTEDFLSTLCPEL